MMIRTVHRILQLLLILTLGIQAWLAIHLSVRGYWNLPEWMTSPLIATAFWVKGHDLDLSYDSLRIYPGKGLRIRNLRYFSERCPCPLLRIDTIDFEFNQSPGAGESPSRLIRIRNASLFFPDNYLPENNNLKLVQDIHLDVTWNPDQLTLNALSARIAALSIRANPGSPLDLSDLRQLLKKLSTHEGGTDADPASILKKLKHLHAFCSDLRSASLSFQPRIHAAQNLEIAFDAYAEAWDQNKGLHGGPLFASGQLLVESDGKLHVLANAGCRTLRDSSLLTIDDIRLSLQATTPCALISPSLSLQVNIAKAQRKEAKLGSLQFLFQQENSAPVVYEGWANIAQQTLKLKGTLDLQTREVTAELSGDVEPHRVTDALDLTASVRPDLIQFHQPALLWGHATLHDWKTPRTLRFRLSGGGVSFKGVPFAFASTQGSYIDRRLRLDHFSASNPQYSIGGQIDENFNTQAYRYQIRGAAFPDDLNPMFRSWWPEIWESFTFRTRPMAVDLDIQGQDDQPSKRLIYGNILLGDLDYRGFPIRNGSLRIYAVAQYYKLFDLNIEHPRGSARGSISTFYPNDSESWGVRQLDLDCRIGLADAVPLLGEDFSELAENLTSDEAPNCLIKGTLANEEAPDGIHRHALDIQVEAPGPVQCYGFRLENVSARLKQRDRIIQIEPLSFRFANGSGEGNLRIDRRTEPADLHFDLKVGDFDYRIAGSRLPGSQTPSPSAAAAAAESGSPSFTTLRLSGSCPVGQLDLLQANGSFELDDPLIHRVHLLGGLSKALSGINLNLGSFSLKRASSSIRMDGKDVFFDDLVLTGPSSRVAAKGKLNLDSKNLDFRLKAYPLREVQFPIIAGLAFMLRPVTTLFSVRLDGTLDEPNWQVTIDARSL
jgi:hypothetical protein